MTDILSWSAGASFDTWEGNNNKTVFIDRDLINDIYEVLQYYADTDNYQHGGMSKVIADYGEEARAILKRFKSD